MISQLSGSRYIRKAIAISFIILLFPFSLPAGENPFNSILPAMPASYSESSFAPFINPVFSDISAGPSLSYMAQNFEYECNANHYLLLDYAGFIFSYAWLDNLYNYSSSRLEPADANLFTIGKGFFFLNMIGAGINYSFSRSGNSGLDDYKALTYGILFRPAGYLSLGFVSRDVNNPEVNGEDAERKDIYSLSVKPLKSISLSLDVIKDEGRSITKDDILYSANLLLKYDISIGAGFMAGDFIFRFSAPFGINAGSAALITDGYASGMDTHSSALGLSFTGSRSRSPLLGTKRFLKITLNREIREIREEKLFQDKGVIFYDLLNSVNMAALDDSISGIILYIDSVELGIAQTQELREEIKSFRKKNKQVYAILNSMGNREYYLASACTKIYFTPANQFYITGLKAEVYFFKQGMDKIGVKFEQVKRGAYKSFAEPYVREHMSREYRENITALLSDLNEQYLSDIDNDRPVTGKEIDDLLNSGLMSPEEARNAGFIDDIEYPEEAEKRILGNGEAEDFTVSLEDYKEEKVISHEWGPRPAIAVIYVSGSIIHGESGGYGSLSQDITGDETYYKALTAAFMDQAVRAVVIRIDSGGGSAFASELMWHYLSVLKKKYNKPVVFSFGNTAASGGYYIACTGDSIMSSRGSVTGSIGVVSGKLSLKELYAKLGINKEVIKMSEFADIFSEANDLSPEERRVMEKGVDYTYKKFTEKVVESRGISRESIDKVAEGRVFSGSQAKENKLVDSFGGLVAAVDLAGKLSGIKNEFTVRHLPESSAPVMEYLGLTGGNSLIQGRLKALIRTLDVIDFKDEYTLYYCPYRFVIK